MVSLEYGSWMSATDSAQPRYTASSRRTRAASVWTSSACIAQPSLAGPPPTASSGASATRRLRDLQPEHRTRRRAAARSEAEAPAAPTAAIAAEARPACAYPGTVGAALRKVRLFRRLRGVHAVHRAVDSELARSLSPASPRRKQPMQHALDTTPRRTCRRGRRVRRRLAYGALRGSCMCALSRQKVPFPGPLRVERAGIEPATSSLQSTGSSAWLSRFRITEPKPFRSNPLESAPSEVSLARNWRTARHRASVANDAREGAGVALRRPNGSAGVIFMATGGYQPLPAVP